MDLYDYTTYPHNGALNLPTEMTKPQKEAYPHLALFLKLEEASAFGASKTNVKAKAIKVPNNAKVTKAGKKAIKFFSEVESAYAKRCRMITFIRICMAGLAAYAAYNYAPDELVDSAKTLKLPPFEYTIMAILIVNLGRRVGKRLDERICHYLKRGAMDPETFYANITADRCKQLVLSEYHAQLTENGLTPVEGLCLQSLAPNNEQSRYIIEPILSAFNAGKDAVTRIHAETLDILKAIKATQQQTGLRQTLLGQALSFQVERSEAGVKRV